MSTLIIPEDIKLVYDDDNIIFTFPNPIDNNGSAVNNFYYMIYDLTGKIAPVKVPVNLLIYDLNKGVFPETTYIFRCRALGVITGRSELTAALMITTPPAPVANQVISEEEPIVEEAQVEEAQVEEAQVEEAQVEEPISNQMEAVIDNDPIVNQEIILPNYEEPFKIESETITLQFPEPKFNPAVNSSKYVETKNNAYLANGYQGRVKYDFDTLLKIRMGKLTTTLK
jgi:hypothetical protein